MNDSQAVCCKLNLDDEFTLLLVAQKFHLIAQSGLCFYLLGSGAELVSFLVCVYMIFQFVLNFINYH